MHNIKGSTYIHNAHASEPTISHSEILAIAAMAFIVVTLFSTSSFLYAFNSWVDTNCIFTVGKSIFCGKIPYKDLLDHKGFLLHLIFGVGSLISFRTFFGLYIMELLSGFFFLLYSYKSLRLFTDKRILFFLPLPAIATYSSYCFEQGGSAEEFCLPLLSASLYIGLRALIQNKRLSNKDAFSLGFLASCVFWIKYTILGLYIGMGVFFVILFLRAKDTKGLLLRIAYFFGGFIPMTIAIATYFLFHHAIADLWTVYFYDNIFHYGGSPGESMSSGIISHEFSGITMLLLVNPIVSCLLIGSFYSLVLQHNKKVLLYSLACFLSTYFFVCIAKIYPYYLLPLVIFLPFSILFIKSLFEKVQNNLRSIKLLYPMLLVFMIGCGLLIKLPSTRFLLFTEDQYTPLTISKDIMKGRSTPPSMLELGIMDIGVYTVCGYVPECRNFCHLNLKLANKEAQSQNTYIETKHPIYLISDKPLFFKDYSQVQIYPGVTSIRYLLHKYFSFIKIPSNYQFGYYYLYKYSKQTM